VFWRARMTERDPVFFQVFRSSRPTNDFSPGVYPTAGAYWLPDSGSWLLNFVCGAHIRKRLNRVSAIGAFNAADMPRPSTRRVSRGSIIPSSQRRALA
jgi:hypothetical protein